MPNPNRRLGSHLAGLFLLLLLSYSFIWLAIPHTQVDLFTRTNCFPNAAFIIIDNQGRLRVSDGVEDSSPLPLARLDQTVAAWHDRKELERYVMVKASSLTSYGQIQPVIDVLRKHNLGIKFYMED